MDQTRKIRLLTTLVADLCSEHDLIPPESHDANDLWQTYRALVNTRPPWPASEAHLSAQNELLQGLIDEAGVHGLDEATPSSVDPRILLWRGDITTFSADAIVNAANSQMLGCWVPGHHCIDNAIHTYAGIQLRAECARIMDEQGFEEPTGRAKITRAYNLPAKRILHTVGPIANGCPTARHRVQLASCYTSCLDLAAREGLRSVAFCCIGTGIFGYPEREAAGIALGAVRTWLDNNAYDMTVVFNVFGDADEQIYRALL